ncbi:MAG: heavy-metal-associated domain-containing protein [Xanthomonadales bacterium]|nr:heavy-metal-associated domain-containing protein [Xanthomonadales bacterium]ODU93052.1 MAG: hypothetical protein ABT18_09800 [Rhodanobacter sp. SCN 66-43]OJY83780.1 MAG: hypothetical protein BGP23_14215 [Xanthomonadales bacterium 66-474]
MFKSASLKVVGASKLHCESCEQRVVRVLNALKGVERVRADASSQRIEILFDPGALATDAIVERLALLGYTTEPAERTAMDSEQVTPGQPR